MRRTSAAPSLGQRPPATREAIRSPVWLPPRAERTLIVVRRARASPATSAGPSDPAGRAGYANQPTSVALGDGLALSDLWISAAVRCAPPDNKPTTEEFDRCEERWLRPEVALLGQVRVVMALGSLAWRVAWRVWGSGSRPAFGHGAEAPLHGGPAWLVGSYHVSQQNTFTGKLTEAMLDAVLARCRDLSG